MKTDPTRRDVWYNGRAFPVSAYPYGLDVAGTHWYVQTPDGRWHCVIHRIQKTAEDGWHELNLAVQSWLAEHHREDKDRFK